MRLESVEQVLNSVVQLDILRRIAAESLGDEVDTALRHLNALLREQRAENLLYLHVDNGKFGVAAAYRSL
ncbi:MAG: hypothetical protein II264_00210, partial [Ruminococcus sp.]|nr:hypothetical protein [Ruminococcus sp.]